jgi:hypothetical protein
VERSSQPGQGLAGVFELDVRNIESRDFPASNDGNCAVPDRPVYVFMPVRPASKHGHEQVARLDGAAVDADAGHLHIRYVRWAGKRKIDEKA